jgi:hypothetical protein
VNIADVVNRIFRDYLDSPADQQLQTRITGSVTDAQTTLVYSSDLTQEEIAAMSLGTQVELDIERMRITAHTESSRTLSVSRGHYGTTPAEHPAGTMMWIAPSVGQSAVFDFLADEIEALSPPLYRESATWGDGGDTTLEIPASPEPQSVLSATQMLGGELVDVEARIVYDNVEFSSGVGISYFPRSIADVSLRYSTDLIRPTALTNTLASLGVRTEWVRALIYGVLSSILIQPDLDHRTQEFITEALQSQGFPPTTGTNLSVAMSRMRDGEVRKMRDGLRVRNAPRVDQRSVL